MGIPRLRAADGIRSKHDEAWQHVYTIQPQLINDRAYFKKGDYSIWWDGEDCWMIGSDFQKGSTSGFAVIQKDVFCLHKASELNWQLAWDQGDWREAGNALGVKCSS